MTPERWAEVETLFDDIVDLPPTERDAHLLTRCAHDPDLRAEVEKMLGDSERAEAMFEAPPLDVARALLTDDEADRDHVTPGQAIGSYRIVELLGRGGMGAVYLAERADGQFDKRVALKIVKRGMDTDEILARFRRERQILARLEHPNIAALYDGGMTPTGLPYFVMELVPGDPIDRWCDLRRASVDDRLRLFLTVCDAVQYAHRNLVVHRDLKPSNIIVCDGEPKLLDFGIAKMLADEDDEGLQVTRLFSRRLTPEYAAPEQVTGDVTTTATDVYSLGVILHELLTGRSPYGDAAGSYTGIENALLQGDARPPSSIVARETGATPRTEVARLAAARDSRPELLRSRLAGDLDAIVCKALQQEPERRYASADALADDIRRHLAGEPVVARPDTAVYRWSKFVRRNRKTVALAGAAVAALTLGMIGTAWQAWEATRARDAAGEAAARAGAARDVLVGTLGSFDPDRLRGRTTFNREEIIAMGLEQLRHLDDQPGLQASVMNTLAQVTFNLGDRDRADTLFQRAFGVLEPLGDHPDLAVSMMGMGEVSRRDLRYADAVAWFRRALETRRRTLPRGHPDIARTMQALAFALYNVATPESVAEANRLYRDVLAYGGAPEDTRAAAYEGLADLSFQSGTRSKEEGDRDAARHFLAADSLYRLAIAAYTAASDARDPAIARASWGLVYVLTDLGRPNEAISAARQALNVLMLTYGRDHRDVGFAHYILGELLFDVDIFSEAESEFEAAAEISADVNPPGFVYTAHAWQWIGRSRLEAGDVAGALTALRHAESEYGTIDSGTDLPDYLVLLQYWRGRAELAAGRPVAAIPYLRRAEREWTSIERPPEDEAARLPYLLAEAYMAIARPDSAAHYRSRGGNRARASRN